MSIKKTQEAKRLIEEMAPQGEFLAFINPKEAGILKAMGGSGKITSMGIPSFTEDEEDTGDVSNPGGSMSGGSGGGNNGDDQEDDNARMMQAMGLTGPGFTNRGGGDDSPSLIDRILGRTTSGINTLRDRLGDRFTKTKNYLTDPSNLRNMGTTALLTSLLGPIGLALSGIGRTQQFQNFLSDLKKDTNTIAEAPQLTIPFDFPNTGDPFKDNYYDRQGNYIGPTVAEAPQLTLPFDFPNTGDPFKDNYYDQQGNYIGPTVTG